MAQPDRRYVPGDFAGQAGYFNTYNSGMQIVGGDLGFSGAELDRIKDDNTMFQFLYNTGLTVDAFDDAVRQHRREMLTGDIGDPTPDFPVSFGGIALPTTGSPVEPGIWERHNKDVARIRKAPAYTPETGAFLGIIPTTPEAPDVGSLKPTAKLEAAMHGYLFSAVVSGREKSDQFEVWVRKAGTETWTLAATAVGKSIDVTFDPGEATGSIGLEVYIQLRQNNANYGQPSDIILVTVNP